MSSPPPPAPGLRPSTPLGPALAGMFLTAGSVLLLEIALTRVFAILLWHHFAYMVVSLALLGFGASGSLLTAFPRAGVAADGRTRAPAAAALYALAVVAAFLVVTRIRIDSLEIWNAPRNFLGLFATYLVLSVPFLFAGAAIGGTLSRHPEKVGPLYFADLVGSAAGGALAPALLGSVGSTATVMIAAAAGAAGGLAFAWKRGFRARLAHGSVTAALLAVALAFTGLVPGWSWTWEIPFAPHKGATLNHPGARIDATIPSATAQVDVSSPVHAPPVIGGQFGDRDAAVVTLRAVTQDGTAPTALHEGSADLSRFPFLDDCQAGSAYVSWKARGGVPKDVLVIGCGGGIDVMVALRYGARAITAVDVNEAMIRMVTRDYDAWLGGLFRRPEVRLRHAEGRSYLRHSGERFDVIQLSGVDTFTALSTGAYTLSESYLYTVEAVSEFVEHLTDGGIVCWSRFMLTWPEWPRETIRLANIVREALDRMGFADPWRHVVVLQAHHAASTMIKRTPFTPAELDALRAFCAEQNFMGLVFDPSRPRGAIDPRGRTPQYEFEVAKQLVLAAAGIAGDEARASESVQRFEREFEQALRSALAGDTAASDRAIETLVPALGIAADDSPGVIALVKKHRDEFVTRRGNKDGSFRVAQQLFDVLIRGEPAERDALVADYVFNLEPATDDRPFFFDYFRLGRFFGYLTGGGDWKSEYHPGFPVGHMVILSSLAQIALLAVLLMLLPLRRVRRHGASAPRRLRTFAYFAALGVGFMFVEIALMQKFILFLGHPTYSLSVVLCGMLAFSGLGALWSTRIARPSRRIYTVLIAVVAALIAVEAMAASLLLPPLLGLGFAWRVAITLALIAPMAFVLGIPFPLGIRLLEKEAPALIPWGWAVNGFLSVFSSMASTLLAMQVGFTAVLLAAAAIYAVGLALAPLPPSRTSGAAA